MWGLVTYVTNDEFPNPLPVDFCSTAKNLYLLNNLRQRSRVLPRNAAPPQNIEMTEYVKNAA